MTIVINGEEWRVGGMLDSWRTVDNQPLCLKCRQPLEIQHQLRRLKRYPSPPGSLTDSEVVTVRLASNDPVSVRCRCGGRPLFKVQTPTKEDRRQDTNRAGGTQAMYEKQSQKRKNPLG